MGHVVEDATARLIDKMFGGNEAKLHACSVDEFYDEAAAAMLHSDE